MKKILKSVLFDTEKMELILMQVEYDETLYLYKGKSKFAKRHKGYMYDNLYEITESEFKEILGEIDAEKYIKLYGNDFEEA